MGLSIVIVNWNSGGMLRKCAESILVNGSDLDFEAIVVDNASSDDSLKDIPDNFKIIRNSKNLGFSKACNQAIKLSKGRYVLLLNPDTLVQKSSLEQMVYFLDKHQDVGILGCKLLNPNGSVQPSCHAFLGLTQVFFEVSQLNHLFPKNRFSIRTLGFFNKFFPKLFANYSTSDNPIEADSVMGSCYMIRRQALEKTGILDENFFLYHEEMELSYRMWKNDYKVMFYPFASVVHYGRYSTKQVPNLVYYERCRSILHFFEKHKFGQLGSLRLIMFFSLLINSLNMPFRKNFKEAFGYRLKVLKLLI